MIGSKFDKKEFVINKEKGADDLHFTLLHIIQVFSITSVED